MNSNGRRPENGNQSELRLRCKDLAGVIEYVGRKPSIFRRRCKNTQCCPRIEGSMAVHRWCIEESGCLDPNGNPFDVGEYITEYVPDKNPSEILGQGERADATRNTRRASV